MSTTTSITEIQSPRLRRLLADLELDPSAVDDFWREAQEVGTPLFEAFDPETRTWLVTFVYRETEPLDTVLLNEWIRYDDFPEKGMEKIVDTDIWYSSVRVLEGLRSQYRFGPNDSLIARDQETDWETRRSGWIPDPLNKSPLIRPEVPLPERLRGSTNSVLQVPGAPSQPWIDFHADLVHGTVSEHRFISQILGNERDIWLYAHPNIDRSKPVPLLVQFDGELFDEVLRSPTVLDNLIAAERIPATAAVFISNVDRGEELPCNPDFVEMLRDELLPFVARELDIKIHGDQTVANGVSYGGLAAMYAGLTAPETFGLVAAHSGSFWWKPNPMTMSRVPGETNEFCWLPEQAAIWPAREIRVWMEAGTLENRSFMNLCPSQLDSNRHMRDVLRARGYDVEYSEYLGGHDFAHWRNSLGDALIHLLGE